MMAERVVSAAMVVALRREGSSRVAFMVSVVFGLLC